MAAPPVGSRRRVIKKVSGHGHHGGAWKIAYADFVTAMMALFMVLWLLASTDEKSRDEISKYFRTGIMPDAELAMNGGAQYIASVMGKSGIPTSSNDQTIEDTARAVRTAIGQLAKSHFGLTNIAGRAQVTVTGDGVLIEVADEEGEGLLFDSASSRLKPALEDFLKVLAPALAQHSKHPIEIQGHTDARPLGNNKYRTNWELSSERAAAARRILEENGVTSEQILGVIGRGSAIPLDPMDPYSARNRRLSILLRNPPKTLPKPDPDAPAE